MHELSFYKTTLERQEKRDGDRSEGCNRRAHETLRRWRFLPLKRMVALNGTRTSEPQAATLNPGEFTSYGPLFGQSTTGARNDNWTSYLEFIRKSSGELLEADKDLTHKRALLKRLSEPAIRTRQPLASAQAFYRNCDELRDDPRTLDKKTLTLTCIYKFARHEWAGIEAAWSAVPTLDQCHNVRSRIARYHLAEEFCHVRLFSEMFKTCHLDRVEWIPMPRLMRCFYAAI
ncbi:MAG TPA: hypothetical protein VF452_01070, partial [Candidatus Binatia bacterium]